jgi:N-terminal acetyltransferase B complex catalytic subunit
MAGPLPCHWGPRRQDRRIQCVCSARNVGFPVVDPIVTVLGKLEASPFPPPIHPYSPDTNPDPNYLPWHGHITALTIAPHARRLGYATKLSESLEQQSDAADAWFVDLFVRASNEIAKELYRKMGYSVFRRVVDYYNDGEDALDMRKPLGRDVGRKHVREGGDEIRVRPEDVW